MRGAYGYSSVMACANGVYVRVVAIVRMGDIEGNILGIGLREVFFDVRILFPDGMTGSLRGIYGLAYVWGLVLGR